MRSPDARAGDGPAADAAPPDVAQLVAMWPAIAKTGQNVLLEGTFSGQPMVELPGGATTLAAVLGDHRASVVIPPNATLGDAKVSSGTASSGNVIFHAVTYEPGLKWFTPYGQADAAHEETQTAERLMAPGVVALGRAIYAIGGNTGGHTFTTHVERASIRADGTLDAFTVLPDVSLVTGRDEFAMVTINNYVYVIGGLGGDGLTSIERAAFDANGVLGTFEIVPSHLNVARVGATAVIVGDFLYVIGAGGMVGTTTNQSIERARIEPDGSLDPFEMIDVTLFEPRQDAGAIVSGNQLYVFGGGSSSDVEAAPIHPDGTIDPFALMPGVSLVIPRYDFASAVVGDGLYLFGGNGSGEVPDVVERAPIHADGTLGTFASTGVAINDRGGLGVAVAGNDVYVIGGGRAGATGELPVLHASIDASDTIGTSTMTSSTLDTPVYSDAVLTSSNAVYAIGGMTGFTTFSAAVQSAPVTDGIVGSFATTSVQLVTARADFGTLTVGNTVYVIGGNTAAGAVGTIERTTVGADGSIGAFAVDPDSALVTPRSQFAVATITRSDGPYVLVLGGLAGDGTVLSSIEQAPINPDGSLGAFQLVGNMTTPRYGHGSFVVPAVASAGEDVYVVGGRNASGFLGDLERGHVDPSYHNSFATGPVPNTGLSVPRASHAIVLLGDHVYVAGGENDTGALDSIEVATFTTDAVNPLTVFAPAAQLAVPRSHPRCSVIANQLYTFGGAGSSGAIATVEAAPLE